MANRNYTFVSSINEAKKKETVQQSRKYLSFSGGNGTRHRHDFTSYGGYICG